MTSQPIERVFAAVQKAYSDADELSPQQIRRLVEDALVPPEPMQVAAIVRVRNRGDRNTICVAVRGWRLDKTKPWSVTGQENPVTWADLIACGEVEVVSTP